MLTPPRLFAFLPALAALGGASAGYISRPDLTPLAYNVTYTAPGAEVAPGFVFLAPRGTGPLGLYIIDDATREPVYISAPEQVVTGGVGAFDWRPQQWQNRTVMGWWDGVADRESQAFGSGRSVFVDEGMKGVATIAGGYDWHESRITRDGTLLVIDYQVRNNVNTSAKALGRENGVVLDGCFHELSMPRGDKLFSFCTLAGGLGVNQSYASLPSQALVTPLTLNDTLAANATLAGNATVSANATMTGNSTLSEMPTIVGNATTATNVTMVAKDMPFDYAHPNSVVKDGANNFLLSNRHFSSLAYISGRNGSVLWRLGGVNSSFTGNGNDFFWQHDAKFVGEGTWNAKDTKEAMKDGTRRISLFDNASNGEITNGTDSRGMLIELDFKRMTADIRQMYQRPNDMTLLSASQGSLQLMDNDCDLPKGGSESANVIMGYGSLPIFAEYDTNGTALQVTTFGNNGTMSYRVFKTSEFALYPTTAPDVVIRGTTLYVSWNGATEVRTWRIHQGDNSTDLPKAGFETLVPLAAGQEEVFVEALSSNGTVLARSDNVTMGGERRFAAVSGTVPFEATATASPTGRRHNGTTGSGSQSDAAFATYQSAGALFSVVASAVLGAGLLLLA